MALLALGPHTFDLAPLNFQEIERETEAKWPAIARFGHRPGRQATGFGEDVLTISGLLYPDEIGGRAEFEAIRVTQAALRPVMMVGWATQTVGKIFGRVVILKIKDTQKLINREGQGRKISFSIEVAPHPDASGRRGIFG